MSDRLTTLTTDQWYSLEYIRLHVTDLVNGLKLSNWSNPTLSDEKSQVYSPVQRGHNVKVCSVTQNWPLFQKVDFKMHPSFSSSYPLKMKILRIWRERIVSFALFSRKICTEYVLRVRYDTRVL